MAFELESFNPICGGPLCTNFHYLRSIDVHLGGRHRTCNSEKTQINYSVPNKNLPLTVPFSCTSGLSFCQLQKQRILVSRYINSSSISYIPQCLDSGAFDEVQCDMELGQCWCVDPEGMEIYGTRQRGKPAQCK